MGLNCLLSGRVVFRDRRERTARDSPVDTVRGSVTSYPLPRLQVPSRGSVTSYPLPRLQILSRGSVTS